MFIDGEVVIVNVGINNDPQPGEPNTISNRLALSIRGGVEPSGLFGFVREVILSSFLIIIAQCLNG